jgi:hypothetical protein
MRESEHVFAEYPARRTTSRNGPDEAAGRSDDHNRGARSGTSGRPAGRLYTQRSTRLWRNW